ncbi:hypothetical protein KZ287_31605, partial [Escherichia coli]|nr:hypothetical protein [Escherichia coli]
LSAAGGHGTRFFNETFDKTLIAARAELDPVKRKQMYRDMSVTVRDEGGVIVPMFNDFIDATSAKVGGWVKDGNQEMSGGYALSR